MFKPTFWVQNKSKFETCSNIAYFMLACLARLEPYLCQNISWNAVLILSSFVVFQLSCFSEFHITVKLVVSTLAMLHVQLDCIFHKSFVCLVRVTFSFSSPMAWQLLVYLWNCLVAPSFFSFFSHLLSLPVAAFEVPMKLVGIFFFSSTISGALCTGRPKKGG